MVRVKLFLDSRILIKIFFSRYHELTDAAKRGVSVDGATAYITHYPCLNCYKALASSGIKHIYFKTSYRDDPVIAELGYEISLSKL